MYKNSIKRVAPASSSQRYTTEDFHVPPGSSRAPDTDKIRRPKLIKYDIHEEKSSQQLLYESARERRNPEKKWNEFTEEIENHINKKKYSQHLVKNLDDIKEWAALHYAVFNNNRFVCNQLTDKTIGKKQFQCGINILTGNGENVLHIVARSAYLWQPPATNRSIEAIVHMNDDARRLPTIIGELIKRGADVNHPDDEGRTPLHLVVMENRLPLVKYLLNKGAKIYATTNLHANVLHFTFIPSGQTPDQLSAMFQHLRDKLRPATTEWRFPWGDNRTNLALMRTLDNRTPLVLAISHPETTEDIIQNLLDDTGVNLKKILTESSEEADIYQTQIFIAIAQVARRRLEKYDCLLPVLTVCNVKMLNQLFHFSCRYDNVNLLHWLIKQALVVLNGKTISHAPTSEEIDLNQTDHAGYTPLLTAVFYGSTKCIEHLMQYSNTNIAQTRTATSSLVAKLDATNADGENILHICAKHDMAQKAFDLIWESAANLRLPEWQDNNGNLPLHVAAGNNQVDMCKKLLNDLKYTKDPLRVKNNQGQTAAHVATEAVPHRIGPERHSVEKHEKDRFKNLKTSKEEDEDQEHDFGLPIIKLMWDLTSKERKRSGLFEKDDDRKTCLHLAAANGQIKIVEFLVKDVGFEVDAVADRRLTPLHLACREGHGEVVAYLIEHGASPTLRNAESYNCLEIAIINQNQRIVEELLTLPNWRELMSNAQLIHDSEAYDTPMRKLIRYLPQVAVSMIENNLTRTFGGQGKHVFKKVYDYEFYMDVYRVKQWYRQDNGLPDEDEEESFSERCHRRGCSAICYCACCGQEKSNDKNKVPMPYTDDAYTLIRNHPLIIASEQSQYPALVDHPYNTFLRDQWYRQNKNLFNVVRAVSFLLYIGFLAVWTAIVLLGKHPQYFFDKVGRNMTLDLNSCANVSRTLTANNDPEALKYTAYSNLKMSLYAFLLLFVVENVILTIALFPRIFRTIDYILEISAFVLTFVYIYDWSDWQNPLIFRCPVQYQLGSMGLLLAWLSLLTYIKRTTWFDMGVFVVMIQLIGFKFIRFIPVLLVIVCGFGFTHWMLLQNQAPFQTPVEAVIRTSLLMFDLGYEDHLYNNTVYYQIIYVVTILSAIIFCIFVLNLLISVAVGEIPSLTEKGKIWQSQVLYDLLSDYSIVSIQLIRFSNFISCGVLGRRLFRKRLQPIVILEHDLKGTWKEKAWGYVQKTFLDEKIQDDIIPINASNDSK